MGKMVNLEGFIPLTVLAATSGVQETEFGVISTQNVVKMRILLRVDRIEPMAA